MPRLLILCEYPTLLGGERSMLSTLPAVKAAGFEVFVAGPPVGLLADAIHELEISHEAFEPLDAGNVRRPLGALREELASLFARLQPDLIHANSLSIARIAGPSAVMSGIPSIGHLRDIVRLSGPAVVDLNSHRRLVAVSAATRSFHIAQDIAGDKCVVIHNGVDLTLFQRQVATGYLKRELNLPPNARLIATVGQISARKGTDVAIEAAVHVLQAFPDVHWLIVGERTSQKEEARNFEAQLLAKTTSSPLAGRVHFLGSRSDMPEVFRECTLFVHAARQEPLGRVLLEAAASGLAVVATDVGGTREIFPAAEDDGVILVPPNDSIALQEAVASLLCVEQRRLSLANAAWRRAETAFNIENAAAQLITLYQDEL